MTFKKKAEILLLYHVFERGSVKTTKDWWVKGKTEIRVFDAGFTHIASVNNSQLPTEYKNATVQQLEDFILKIKLNIPFKRQEKCVYL